MPAATAYPHISLDEDQVPFVTGTTMKVVELVMAQRAHGWSAEELHFQFPHLSLGEIHSALGYYWDHQEELDQDIERRSARVKQIQQATRMPEIVTRLRASRPS
jgi:uncharacterized protein (DUF433 family)